MNNKIKLILTVLMIFIIFLFFYLLYWQSPDINEDSRSLESCLKHTKNNRLDNTVVESIDSKLKVEMAISDNTCINPYFPTIRITSDKNQPHTAWLHIVHTDADNDQLKIFIDAAEDYPFYSFDKVFLDAPLWTYSLLDRPLTFWEGHAYSVHIEKGKILSLGGVRWGFRLLPYSIRPTLIYPKALTTEDFNNEMHIIQTKYKSKSILDLK